jgi:hypothetical protein
VLSRRASAPLCVRLAPPPLSLEPVAQKDQSAGLRHLRAHVRVVPGSLLTPGSSKGRTPVFGTGDGGSSPPPGFVEDGSGWGGVIGKRTALRSPWAACPLGVRVPPPALRAGVVQMADTPSSEGGSCEFESHLPYQSPGGCARGPNGRGGSLKKSSGAGSTPAARIHARA